MSNRYNREGLLADRFGVYSPTSENPANSLANLVIWGAGSGGDANPDRLCVGKPIRGFCLFLGPEWAVANSAGSGIDVVGIFDVKGADTFRTESRQRESVARVVTPDDDHHIERLPQQLDDGVLALLGGAADRIESTEVFPRVFHPVGARHRLSDQFSNGQRF